MLAAQNFRWTSNKNVLGRRLIRAVWRVSHGQTKKNGEVFRRHIFPPFWLMNRNELAAADVP